MPIMNGAERQLISMNYTRRSTHKSAVILHTADSPATGAAHFRYWNRDPHARASSHFYVDYDGKIWQLVDTKYIAWTSGSANTFSIGIETQGFGNEPWTAQQVKSLAKILAWANQIHGIPLTLMRSSNETSGIGYHRLGVPATALQKFRRVSQTGGPLWSSATGKICPGAKRESQIPQIIRIAAGKQPAINEENELNTDQDKKLTAIFDTLTKGQEHVKYDGEIWKLVQDVKATTSRLDKRLARLEAETVDADILGDPKAKGIANALRRLTRWIEPPEGKDPRISDDAPWNRWLPWREALKKIVSNNTDAGDVK